MKISVLPATLYGSYRGNIMTPARDPKQKKIMINPLKIGFVGLKTPGFFRDFLGDHFARSRAPGEEVPPQVTHPGHGENVTCYCAPPEESMRRRTMVSRDHGYPKRGTGARFG